MVRLLVLGCTLWGSACAMGEATDAAVDPRVTVLTHVPGVDMAVLPDALELTHPGELDLDALAPGDILVSGEGEGFLRTVESVRTTGDHVTIATSDADLGDALIDASIAESFGGAGKADTHQLPEIALSFGERLLVDDAAAQIRMHSGTLSLRPEIDLDMDIARRRLELFELVLRGKLSGSLDLAFDVGDAAVGEDIVLWRSPPTIFYQQVGFFPVVETVTSSVVLRLEATARGSGRVRIVVDSAATLEGGVRYDRANGWRSVAALDLETSGAVPESSATLEAVGVRAWLQARTDVKLYGIAGPYVSVGPQVELGRDLVENDLDGHVGFRGQVGGELKIWKLNVPGIPSADLFNVLEPVF